MTRYWVSMIISFESQGNGCKVSLRCTLQFATKPHDDVDDENDDVHDENYDVHDENYDVHDKNDDADDKKCDDAHAQDNYADAYDGDAVSIKCLRR